MNALIRRAHTSDEQRDAGYVAIMAMLMLFLLALISTVFIQNTQNAVMTTKATRDYSTARQAANLAADSALYRLNTNPTFPGSTASMSTISPSNAKYRWYMEGGNTTTPMTLIVEGDYSSAGNTANAREFRYPLRTTHIGSFNATDSGALVYGITSQGAWRNALTSFGNVNWNTANGVDGTIAMYGNGRVSSVSANQKITLYADNATATAASGPTSRAAISARHDRKLLDEKIAKCDELGWNAGAVPVTLLAGTFNCFDGDITLPNNLAVSGAAGSVAEIVTRGSVTVAGTISSTSQSQVHVYAEGNSVAFTTNSYATLWTYAPNAHCTSTGTAAPRIVGSLACRRIDMSGTVTKRLPNKVPAAVIANFAGTDAKRIFYIESNDYSDAMTDYNRSASNG